MYNITFQQIEAFLTIAKYQNLSKAAGLMYISQPALSKTLQRFEEGVGIRMFSRGNQGVVLTPEGAYLYSVLQPLYGSLLRALETARTISSMPSKTIRIVMPEVYDISEIFKEAKHVIRKFEESYPQIVLMESLREFRELRDALEFGEADIAIVQDFVLNGLKDISYKRISDFPMYIAVSVGHPLAASDELKPEDLESEVFFRVAYTPEEDARETYTKECRLAGFLPKQFEFLPNVQTMIHKLLANKGLAICGKFAQFDEESAIKYYPLNLPGYQKYVVAAWRSEDQSAETKQFISALPGEVYLSAGIAAPI
ncbi:MAG: LysR family transcriptional regulator [Clostridiales Family XIII bacterium]|jgi:DNA-binding transcriptional LysR family regulator|nr:LysR family transcriptional regulator [Clostridiales Family XIII bacterium]